MLPTMHNSLIYVSANNFTVAKLCFRVVAMSVLD